LDSSTAHGSRDRTPHRHNSLRVDATDKVFFAKSIPSVKAAFMGLPLSRIALDTSSLLWALLFGSIGLAFFVYGRRQRTVVPLTCGIALMILPYFVSNTVLLVTLGVALIAIPYFVRM
jgi:hypothetical protein